MRRVIASGMIANALEWYDYALYGLLASTISKLFFPSEDPTISLIATFGVFAAGFVMRPIGAILFGYIGDKYGRRASLVISIVLMAVPTACIGILPTYATIGIAAPIALTLIRLLQGLSLGGEFSGSIAFVVEHAPDNHRGKAGATTMFSMVIGILTGSAVAYLLTHNLTPEQFESWGWRVPFLIGLLAGIVGYYIRHSVDESPKYLQAKEDGTLSAKPLADVFAHHKRSLFEAIGVYILVTVPFYTLAIFMTSFMIKFLNHTESDAYFMNTINMVVLLFAIPVAACLSDTWGRKPVLIFTAALFLLGSGPIFWLICQPGFTSPLIGQILFSILVGLYIGPVPALLVELFPTSVRYTGMALSYNLCAAIFGGTTPLVATWLIRETNSMPDVKALVEGYLGNANAVVAFYIILCAIIAIITLAFYKDRYDKPLL
jgi:MFS transporter, MHS family, proline/betaine transporter